MRVKVSDGNAGDLVSMPQRSEIFLQYFRKGIRELFDRMSGLRILILYRC